MLKRMKEEHKFYEDNKIIDINLRPSKNLYSKNSFHYDKWYATIKGPCCTPYENIDYNLQITIPITYPREPPVIKMTTFIEHPNICGLGLVDLDILKTNEWNSDIYLYKIIECIIDLLKNPNLENPINERATIAYKNNIKKICDANKLLSEEDYTSKQNCSYYSYDSYYKF